MLCELFEQSLGRGVSVGVPQVFLLIPPDTVNAVYGAHGCSSLFLLSQKLAEWEGGVEEQQE